MGHMVLFGKPPRRNVAVALAGLFCVGLLVQFAFDSGTTKVVAADEKGLLLCNLVCPSDIIIEFIGSCTTTVGIGDIPDPTFTGDCERMGFTYSVPDFIGLPVGIHPVVCTADNGDTCSFNVIIRTDDDMVPPEITCPADMVKKAKQGTDSALVDYAIAATDNCSVSLLVEQLAGLAPGDQFPLGKTTNTWQVTDASGNTDQCSFDVTIVAFVKVTQPSDTTVFQGFKTPVRWKSGGLEGDVRIELRRDGAFVRTIKETAANDGRLNWRVPASLPAGGGYTIRIISVDDPAVFGDSDKAFRVKSPQ